MTHGNKPMITMRCLFWTVTTFLGCAVSGGLAPSAWASYIILTNPNQFSAGSTLVTFDEGDFDGHLLQPFEVVTSYRGIGFQALGAPPNTWPQAAFDPTPPREFGPGGDAGKTILQVQFPPVPAQGLEITLAAPVIQFGAEFKAVTAGDFTFTLFAGSQPVDVVTLPAGPLGQVYNFHAFEDSSFFDRVTIQGPGSMDGRVIMDNLRLGPVPEPCALILTGIGIVSLLGATGRRCLYGQERGRAQVSGTSLMVAISVECIP